jgi:hypothetical protein
MMEEVLLLQVPAAVGFSGIQQQWNNTKQQLHLRT